MIHTIRFLLTKKYFISGVIMYILASNFSKKRIIAYLKLKIRVVCREYLSFKYVLIVFFETRFFGTQYHPAPVNLGYFANF